MGPNISDLDFFKKQLDLNRDGMEQVCSAVMQKDYVTARKEYASFIKANLNPQRFFSIPYEVPENEYTLPNETELEAAERICTKNLISCGTAYKFEEAVDWYHNPTYNQYPEWTWQLSRHHEFKLLAHVYNQTSDERYAACCAELFTSWVKQAIYPGPMPNGWLICWRTIECGIRMGASWPYALHSFYKSPHFTDDILVDWAKSVCEHSILLHEKHKDGNWLIMEMNGLAISSIIFPEFKHSKAWLAYSFGKMESELARQFYPDGFHYELSTNYHEVVLANYRRLILVANAYEIAVPTSFTSALENAASVYVKLMMPNGRLPNINDGSNQFSSVFLKDKLSLFQPRKDFEWVASNGELGESPDYTSIAMPYSGFLIMRSGWEKNDVWALFDSAPFGRGHQHEDKLSLMLFAQGKLLLTEGGNYAYDSSKMRKYVLSTRSHNTVRIDMQDQNRKKNYKWSEEDILALSNLSYQITPEFDFGEGCYNEGYGDECEISVTHKRSVIFIKKPKYNLKPFFIVVDRMLAQEEHIYETLWQLDGETLTLTEHSASINGLYLISSKAISSKGICYGQKQPEWQGFAAKSFKQGDYVPLYTLKCIGEGSELRTVTVLYPTEEAQCPITGVEASESIEDTQIILSISEGVNWILDETDFCQS